jgi:hypothetical protein
MEIHSLSDIANLAEILSALAVVITLGYLAIQIRQSNKHAMLQSIQSITSSMNGYCDLIANSDEVASIIISGRKSLSNLSESENERFIFIHFRLLNTLELMLMMINESYLTDELRNQLLKNTHAIIANVFKHPGALEFWKNLDPAFAMPELHELVLKYTDYNEIS